MFCREQIASLSALGVTSTTFYIENRTSGTHLLNDVGELRKFLGSNSQDLIHAHYGTATATLGAVVRGKAKLVISFRGSDLQWDPAKSWLRDTFSRTLSQIAVLPADATICVSEPLQSRILFQKKKQLVLSDGIDLGLFMPEPQWQAREALGWNQDESVVLFSARPDQTGKGIELVQEVMRRLKRRLPNCRLEHLRGEVSKDQVARSMNASNCLIMASLREGSPNIVKEALACNLPVISSPVGDVPELLEGVSPSAVVERTTENFAQALLTILQKRKRSNGRIKAEDFGMESTANRLLSFYQEVLR